LLQMLTNASLRSAAIEALAAFGERIVGTLGDVLLDTTTPVQVRHQIPRVLRHIPTQKSVEVLFHALNEPDLTLRSSALKALNRIRETKPKLNYGRDSLTENIMKEARYYYEMSAALYPFRETHDTPAARILYETIEGRLKLTLDRLFRLLGLKYPPREIYAAYLSLSRPKTDEYIAAIEFLDTVLDRELKRYIMPLLDEQARVPQAGRDLFGLVPSDMKTALRELMRSGDSWLVACAVATAAELKATELRTDIEPLARKGGTEVGPVAQSALAALASAS
jgi:ATP:ADP antiporter, AAA family